jgi:C4-dicarboxylate transporter, DctM subunit
MEPITIGFVGLGAILLLIALRMPIAVALLAVGCIGIAVVSSVSTMLSLLGSLPFDFAANWELSAIPLFLLMGSLAARTGLTAGIFEAARILLSPVPGGLAVATNFACAGFSAASGSSVATTIAMGRIAIPEMFKAGYDRGLAAAVCACAGTLGSMIPPSAMMIVYCIFTRESIIAVFAAGVLPGLLTAAVYAAMIITRCKLNPKLAPPYEVRASRAEKIATLKTVWPLPVLVLIVLGGIYGGVFTPTEAAAFGAVATFLMAAALRLLNWDVLKTAVAEAVEGTAAIFFIAIGAIVLTRFMLLSGVPDFIAGYLNDIGATALGVVFLTLVIYLVLGCFLEPIGIMLLTLPVLLPSLQRLGVDMVWFGILIVKFLEIGLITPPVGLNVFAAKTLVGEQMSLGEIFRGANWFLACEAVVVALLIAFPAISLILPRLLNYH